MELKLDGKVAVVTGASAGIGWSCARGLAAVGATVVIVARDSGALKDARDRLSAALPDADVRSVNVDLSTQDGCEQLTLAEPRCDILVNNLGLYQPKPFFETSDRDWYGAVNINLMPGVRLSRAYMPAMMNDGWGRIVFLASEAGINIPTDSLTYGVSKAGVLALSRGLAKVAGRSGVTVNAVLPGVTASEWVVDMIKGFSEQGGKPFEEAAHDAVVHRYPTSITQRVQTVEEVSNLVVYLCSKLSSATTGSALRAEGGIIETPF